VTTSAVGASSTSALKLGQIEEHLGLFIELAICRQPYQRGSQASRFYLTSAPQVVDSAQQTRSAGARKQPAAFHASHGRFIKTCLSSVIFPEADLAGLDGAKVNASTGASG